MIDECNSIQAQWGHAHTARLKLSLGFLLEYDYYFRLGVKTVVVLYSNSAPEAGV